MGQRSEDEDRELRIIGRCHEAAPRLLEALKRMIETCAHDRGVVVCQACDEAESLISEIEGTKPSGRYRREAD